MSEWESERRLIITDCPAGMSPQFMEAWARRQRANTTGRCECGAVIEMPNRAARRRAQATGETLHARMLHEHDCPAADDNLRKLYRASLS